MGKKAVPLGSYRGQFWFCQSVNTGAEGVVEKKVLLRERRSAGDAKGETVQLFFGEWFGAHRRNRSNA
jgi:hypothetical protein